MTLDWDGILTNLESTTRRLCAMDSEDMAEVKAVLDARAEVIVSLRETLAAEAVPADVRRRLEKDHAHGQAAMARLVVRREALRSRWKTLNREAQWLQRACSNARFLPHSIDCSG